jgi:hypothetical protein
MFLFPQTKGISFVGRCFCELILDEANYQSLNHQTSKWQTTNTIDIKETVILSKDNETIRNLTTKRGEVKSKKSIN